MENATMKMTKMTIEIPATTPHFVEAVCMAVIDDVVNCGRRFPDWDEESEKYWEQYREETREEIREKLSDPRGLPQTILLPTGPQYGNNNMKIIIN